MWSLRGSRPRAVRQTKYEWLYVIGAVCPQTGQSVGLLSPTINTDMMNAFFEQFTAEVSPDVHIVMVWDQAGFHRSKKLKLPENVTIVQLPPYSPELNPVENLWHYLRSHYWANRIYADYYYKTGDYKNSTVYLKKNIKIFYAGPLYYTKSV